MPPTRWPQNKHAAIMKMKSLQKLTNMYKAKQVFLIKKKRNTSLDISDANSAVNLFTKQ